MCTVGADQRGTERALCARQLKGEAEEQSPVPLVPRLGLVSAHADAEHSSPTNSIRCRPCILDERPPPGFCAQLQVTSLSCPALLSASCLIRREYSKRGLGSNVSALSSVRYLYLPGSHVPPGPRGRRLVKSQSAKRLR